MAWVPLLSVHVRNAIHTKCKEGLRLHVGLPLYGIVSISCSHREFFSGRGAVVPHNALMALIQPAAVNTSPGPIKGPLMPALLLPAYHKGGSWLDHWSEKLTTGWPISHLPHVGDPNSPPDYSQKSIKMKAPSQSLTPQNWGICFTWLVCYNPDQSVGGWKLRL